MQKITILYTKRITHTQEKVKKDFKAYVYISDVKACRNRNLYKKIYIHIYLLYLYLLFNLFSSYNLFYDIQKKIIY